MSPEFITLVASGAADPPATPDHETIYVTGGRIRWDLSPGSAVENGVNTAVGTHDGLDTTYDRADAVLDDGLAYRVGYSVSTPTLTVVTVTLRFRYRATTISGASIALCELSGVYDDTVLATITPVESIWTWVEFEMEDDPATGLPWANAAAVSAKKWGFDFNSGITNGVTSFSCSEIELLIESQ